MPIVRPKPRQVSQAPSGELKEKQARRRVRRSGCRSRRSAGRWRSASGAPWRRRRRRAAWTCDAAAGRRAARPRAPRRRGARSAPARRRRSWMTSSVLAVAGVDARVALRCQQRAAPPPRVKLGGTVHREGDRAARGSAAVPRRLQRSRRRCSRACRAAPAGRSRGSSSLRGAREEQLEVVVQLRHRADGGARGAHRVGLVDGDGRRDAVDAVDLRLVHAVEELARVGREGLDVAALALGVERVEGQRGLARAR